MQFIRKYGVAFKIRIPVVKAGASDFAVGADWTPATGDVKISKDSGAAANITTLPAAIAMGNGAIWEFAVSATEAQAAEITITVVDSATKAVQDQALSVITFGNASAGLVMDLSINQTGDAYGRLGAPAGASVSADVAAVKGDTGTILTDVNSGAGAIYNRLGAPAGASIAADIAALPTANGNADALLDRSAGIETSRTLRQALRLMLSALCGKASGLATTTAVFRDTNDSKDRITATVDADGNRSAVTLDAT